MIASIKAWLYNQFRAPYTIACDYGAYWQPMLNEREMLFYRNGLFFARWFAKGWVAEHSSGQARIIPGHVTWPEEESKDGTKDES